MKMTICSKCNMPMNVLGPEDDAWRSDLAVLRDAREHRRVHQPRLARFKKLGITVLNVTQREALKARGQDLLHFGQSPQQREQGAELIAQAYYNRSLSEYADDDLLLHHPSFDEYMANLDLEEMFPNDVAAWLRAKYGPATGVRIDPYTLHWLAP